MMLRQIHGRRRKFIKKFFKQNANALILIGMGFLIILNVWQILIFCTPEKDSKVDTEDLIAELEFKACLTALEGEGIKITLHDSDRPSKTGENLNAYVIHDDDLLRVINELRAAGAEGIAINGQRLTALSEIRCAGPTLSVNNVRSSAPFEIVAIGEKQTLHNAIKMRGGVADTLSVWGIKLDVEMSDEVYIPPYKGDFQHNHAHVPH